jgi:glucose/arabinose dehydrogenase
MPTRARRIGRLSAIALALTLAVGANVGIASTAHAADAAGTVKLRRLTNLGGTTAFAARKDDSSLYVTEQSGLVRAIRAGKLVARPVLDLQSDTAAAGEQGLLGLAFAPDGSKLYVDYTDKSGDTHIDEFTMNGRVADQASRRNLLVVDQPQPNHNGGQLAFGPDGDLYIAFGDGGAANDEGAGHANGGNGQSLNTLLGKILRIDPTPGADAPYTVPATNPFVDRAGARPEIWAYGLRNPWRFSFDTDNGDLWIGDVGQDEWEEVDVAPAPPTKRDAGSGDNFGWNRLEGTHPFRGNAPAGAVPPVYEQSHDDGACSVTGGFVYRGKAIPSLVGKYVFTDYCDGALRTLSPSGDGNYRADELDLSAENVSSFGQDNNGELYVLSQSNGIFKLVPR